MKKLLFVLFLLIAGNVNAQIVLIPKDASGTVGTSYKAVLPSQPAREYLLIENGSASNYMAFTYDNTVPVVNGAGSITLAPYQIYNADSAWVPTGGINVIGSGSGTVYTVKYR